MSSRIQRFALLLVLLVVIGFVIRDARKSDHQQAEAPSAQRASEQPAAPAQAKASEGEQERPASPKEPEARDRARRLRYEELHRRLLSVREKRLSSAKPESEEEEEPGLPPPPLRVGSLDKEYIQEQIKEIVPLIKECYDQALELQPGLGGKVVVQMELIGEEDVGGLIESSEVDPEASSVTDPGFLECVRETMYAVELDAPEGGGSVKIRYPLVFRADADESEESADEH